ncbi:transketolase, partial [Streptococcus suis]
ILFVDDNKKQLDGRTHDICQTFDYVEKFQAFGWESVRVNGDDIDAIINAIITMKSSKSPQPKCIVLDTTKGQGVT